jgi:hypothetical protein
VHIKPGSDFDGTLPEATYPPNTANSIKAIIKIRIVGNSAGGQDMNIVQDRQTKPLPLFSGDVVHALMHGRVENQRGTNLAASTYLR